MLKLGLVGWGYWGRNYAKYFDSGLDARLAMVCDLRDEMLKDARQLYPHITVTKDTADLAKKKLDGVIIASHTSVHYKLASFFIEKRIPLLIEKPLTNSYATAKELENLAKSNSVKILVGHTFLYNQSVRFLKKEIEKGSLGKLYYLEFRRQSYGPIRDDVNIIWDFAPHDLAITKYLLGAGYPETVYAEAGKFSRNNMEDIAIITLTYPGNVLVNINVGWLYPIKIRSCTILGDKKMAVFEDTSINEPVKIYDTSLSYPKEDEPVGASFRLGDVVIPRIASIDPLALQLRHFVNYLKGLEKPITPVEDGVSVVAVLEAVNESMKSGTQIRMSRWLKEHAS